MNNERAAWAAGAGCLSAVLVVLAMAAWALAVFSGTSWLSNSEPQYGGLALLVTYAATPIVLFGAGTLLAVASGGGLVRSPLIAGVVLAVTFLIVKNGSTLLGVIGLPRDRTDVLTAIVLVLAPAFIVSAAALWRGGTAELALVLLVSTIALAALSSLVVALTNALVVGWLLSMCSWIVLPAIAAGFRTHDDL